MIIDGYCNPLGFAYSSRVSLEENFKPKEVVGASEPLCVVTLHSRKRGVWPKGLKNPNTDKAAPLPDRLELSSGNYLVFRQMKTNKERSAVMIVADVLEGHGFCHERYDDAGNLYSDEAAAPSVAVPYRSCFHRYLLL